MNQQQQQPGMFQQAKSAFGWLLFICNSLAVSVEVFLHKGVGSRYIGLQGLAAVAMIFFWGGFWPDHDVIPMLTYLLFYLLFCFAQRMDSLKRARQGGEQEHSRYTGRPLLMRFTGRMNEIAVKRIVEPVFVFLVGVFICSANEPLGKYLMLAAVGLLVSVQSTLVFDQTRATDMNDAMIDQQHAAKRFREMRGDHFLN
jgi:hypothetical protein